jgi:hypothetical protein
MTNAPFLQSTRRNRKGGTGSAYDLYLLRGLVRTLELLAAMVLSGAESPRADGGSVQLELEALLNKRQEARP